jgi:hypothetical protein
MKQHEFWHGIANPEDGLSLVHVVGKRVTRKTGFGIRVVLLNLNERFAVRNQSVLLTLCPRVRRSNPSQHGTRGVLGALPLDGDAVSV